MTKPKVQQEIGRWEIRIFSDNEIYIPWIFWAFLGAGIFAVLFSIALTK